MDSRLSEGASHPAIAASTPCITIDNDISIPLSRNGGYTQTGVGPALRALEIGQSFVWPNSTRKPIEYLSRKTGPYFTRLRPKKFTQRRLTENGVRVLRVWRMA